MLVAKGYWYGQDGALQSKLANVEKSIGQQITLLDKEKLAQMGQIANKVAIENVEDKIYEEIKKLVKN